MLRSNLVVAVGTAMSRLTGLIRIVVFSIVIGQTALADAYDGANNSPNAVYELLLGGVLSASLVPLLTKHAEDDDDEATTAVVTVSVIALTFITVLAFVAAPLIFHIFSFSPPKAIDANQYRKVGTALARIFLLQIFFYGLSALGAALLNARRRFFAAAWSPVLSNLVIIFSLLLIPTVVDHKNIQLGEVLTNSGLRLMLGLGATIGIAVMAIALLPALKAAKVPWRINPNFRHPAVRKLVQLSGWTLGYAVANQIAVIVVKNLALGSGVGQQAAYTAAFTFFVLPHGLLAVSIATTFAPELSRFVARRDKAAFMERSSLGIRMVALLTMPAGLGLFVLRRSIIGGILQHGRLTPLQALNTSRALGGFAIGLVGFSVYLFVLRGFYAHQDARTPFIINLFENAMNIVLAWILVGRYGVLGLGLSFAIAYLLSAALALLVLSYKVSGFEVRPIYESLWRMMLAATVMAETVWWASQHVGANVGGGAIARSLVGTVIGAIVYVVVLLVLRAPELDLLRNRILPRAQHTERA
jgi:putative peptidoglycan lipid II flippase